MQIRSTAPVIAALMLAGLLQACSESSAWRTTAVGPEFPSLDFELATGNGQTLSEPQLQGKVTLLYFGYLSCPDVCPTTMAKLQSVLETLPEEQRDEVRVLFVSVDPERDTPQRVAEYAEWFGPQFIGATGELEQVRALTNRYGTSFRKKERDDGNDAIVIHGSNLLAFDREGRARLMIPHDASNEAIRHDLLRLIAS